MECLSILSLAGVVLFYQDSAVIMAINLSKYTGGVAHIRNYNVAVSNGGNLCHPNGTWIPGTAIGNV